MTISSYLNQPYSRKNLAVLFCAAFIIRGLFFGLYIQHEERYFQADTRDYFNGGYCMAAGNGMTMPSGRPIFWRTPGYPLYLALFYGILGVSPQFSDNGFTHKIAIWVQIILCSLIPIFLFFLALLLTGSLPVSWLAGWIGALHLGFTLASCYILSDALALIFFILFLIYFYKSFSLLGEESSKPFFEQCKNSLWAALYLGLYTWVRPNGQFVIAVGIALFLLGMGRWKQKFIKSFLFGVTFILLIMPWCLRNYTLTGELFYCPMSGPIMQAFMYPKILRDLTGRDLHDCWKESMQLSNQAIRKEVLKRKQSGSRNVVSHELVCKKVAWPLVMKHPFYLMYEWVKEAIKATFDLYGSQIVRMVQNKHKFDPLEEVLSEKISLCLYEQPMHVGFRLIIWLEFLWVILKWFGIFFGTFLFVLYPLLKKFDVSEAIKKNCFLFIKVGFMAGSLLAMTGGFGYARLRLPIDPLLMVMSLMSWYYIFLFINEYKRASSPGLAVARGC